MTFSNSLADTTSPLILDTSVLINLHASRHGEIIIAALPHEVLVPETVVGELNHPTGQSNGEAAFVSHILSTGIAKSISLSDEEYAVFQSIVAGTNSLGDGEAASIALAAHREHFIAMDDRKGRNQARSMSERINLCWSLDLFLLQGVEVALGAEATAEAVFLALRDGRMRIHDSHCDHVVNLIGIERALVCTSLPGYRTRKSQWESIVQPHPNSLFLTS